MRNTLLTIFAAVVLTSCSKKESIVGEWTNKDKYGETSTTIFKEDGGLTIIKGNKVEDFNFKEKTIKYSLDHSHQPYWLDIIIYDDKNKEEVVRMKGICEFLSDNTLRVCFNEPSRYEQDLNNTMLVRPDSFIEKDTEVLSRK